MAIKTIETKAVISAEDKTGATFSKVAEKLKSMEGTAKTAAMTTASIGGNLGGITKKADEVTKSIDLMGAAIAGAAALGIAKLAEMARSVIDVGNEMDKLQRRQAMLLKLTPEQTKAFDEQAERLARTYGYGAPEVTKARTELATRGLGAGQIMPLIENAAKFALVEGVELPEAAKLLQAQQFQEGEKALGPKALAHRMDELVKAGQIGGMSPEDMQEALRGGLTESGGLSRERILAIAAVLSKGQVPMPGATTSMIVAKLNRPDKEALATLAAMGIDVNRFMKPAQGLKAANLSAFAKEQNLFGTDEGLSARGLKGVQAILNNPAIAGDQGKLSKALTDFLMEGLGGDKPAAVKKMSANIKKVVAEFLKSSIGDVDVGGLLDALAAANPSAAQAETLGGKRKGLALKKILEQGNIITDFEKQIGGVPPDFTGSQGKELLEGPYGAELKARKERELAEEKLAEAGKSAIMALYSAETMLARAFNDATPEIQRMTAAAAAFAALAGATGFLKLWEKRGLVGAAAAVIGAPAAAAWSMIPTLAALPAVAAIGTGALLASTTPAGLGEDELRRQRLLDPYGNGPYGFGKVGVAPPGAGVSFPTSGPGASLAGQATIRNSLVLTFDPGIIAKEVRTQLDASGNMRADTGVSMPR